MRWIRERVEVRSARCRSPFGKNVLKLVAINILCGACAVRLISSPCRGVSTAPKFGATPVETSHRDLYVGELTVLGLVKGTSHDRGNATIAPESVAEKFHAMYRERGGAYGQIS